MLTYDHHLTVRLPAPDMAKLRDMAQRRNVSVACLVREALAVALAKAKEEEPCQANWQARNVA